MQKLYVHIMYNQIKDSASQSQAYLDIMCSKNFKFGMCIQWYGRILTQAHTLQILCSKGFTSHLISSHLAPTFIESLQLYCLCFPSCLGTNTHGVFNGQPWQLGLTEQILHTRVFGSALNYHKALFFHSFNLHQFLCH